MTWQASEESGGPETFRHVISYCDAPHSDWQLSVPPDTPPSSRIVAPEQAATQRASAANSFMSMSPTDRDPSPSKRRPMGSRSLRAHTSNTYRSCCNCRSSKANRRLLWIPVCPRCTQGNCSGHRHEGKTRRRWRSADLPLLRHLRKPPSRSNPGYLRRPRSRYWVASRPYPPIRAPSPHRLLPRSRHPCPCHCHSRHCCWRSTCRSWTTKPRTETSRPRRSPSCLRHLAPDRRWCRLWHIHRPPSKPTLARRVAPRVAPWPTVAY
jgi:hypothetical protein